MPSLRALRLSASTSSSDDSWPFIYTHSISIIIKSPLIVVIVMGIAERIKEIEDEMARTQKNKATEFHMGQLKAKLAKLRTQLL